MTMPDERRRNLIWGREALEELSRNVSVPHDWREESALLLSSYPSVARIRHCSDDGLESLRIEHAEALEITKALFQRIRCSPACSDRRRYAILVILRHFY